MGRISLLGSGSVGLLGLLHFEVRPSNSLCGAVSEVSIGRGGGGRSGEVGLGTGRRRRRRSDVWPREIEGVSALVEAQVEVKWCRSWIRHLARGGRMACRLRRSVSSTQV